VRGRELVESSQARGGRGGVVARSRGAARRGAARRGGASEARAGPSERTLERLERRVVLARDRRAASQRAYARAILG